MVQRQNQAFTLCGAAVGISQLNATKKVEMDFWSRHDPVLGQAGEQMYEWQ